MTQIQFRIEFRNVKIVSVKLAETLVILNFPCKSLPVSQYKNLVKFAQREELKQL